MNQLFQSKLRRNTINSSESIYLRGTFICALKSSRTTSKYGFLSAIESRLRLKLSSKDSNLSLDWQGDL